MPRRALVRRSKTPRQSPARSEVPSSRAGFHALAQQHCEDFLLGPTAGKEKRDATQRHHTDCVRSKRHWHQLPQATHFANVLFALAPVNDGAGSEKQERLEKAMREQMHDASRNTAHA